MEGINRLIIKCVLDAGPIIHLDEIDTLHLLSDFDEILVPVGVWHEVEYHRPAAFKKDIKFKKTLVPCDEKIAIICNSLNLDEGEIEAISLCVKNKGLMLLTDDAAARLAASLLGIRAYGTVGILLRAIRKNQLAPADVIKKLEEIPVKSTLFIKHSLLNEIIEEIKKRHR